MGKPMPLEKLAVWLRESAWSWSGANASGRAEYARAIGLAPGVAN
jgi:hypothetical protein